MEQKTLKETGGFRRGIMKKSSQGIFILLLLPCLGRCTAAETNSGSLKRENAEILNIAIWNVQALFDGEEAGTEYDEYLNVSGWNREKYAARLNVIAQAIGQMSEKSPDILGLVEIENSHVLEDIAQGPLAKHAYHWTFFGNNPGAALGLGLISRFPFTETKIHSITSYGETAPRPILEVWLEPYEKPLILFICHWKSKVGGDKITEALRRSSARIISRRLGEIAREFPGIPVVIMGDLNENHDEFYRQAGLVISALLPDDPNAAELAGFNSDFIDRKIPTDFLILSPQKPPESEYFTLPPGALYSPWGNELEGGSYNYKGEWETIDHFLLNSALFNQTGWDFDSCRVLNKEPFINDKGHPAAYNPRTGYGLSDHLPLVLTLKGTSKN